MGHIQPSAGVICLECEEQPASGRKHGHITSHRVIAVQHGRVKGVFGLRYRGRFWRATNNKEVMALYKIG